MNIFNIIILLNIISLFMSLNLIKNEKTFCLTTYLYIEIKYLNNYMTKERKNLR